MPTPQTTAADEIVTLTQLAESYRSLALAGTHYAADLTSQLRRNERTIDGLRGRLAEKEAENAALKAEITRYTRSQVAASEAA